MIKSITNIYNSLKELRNFITEEIDKNFEPSCDYTSFNKPLERTIKIGEDVINYHLIIKENEDLFQISCVFDKEVFFKENSSSAQFTKSEISEHGFPKIEKDTLKYFFSSLVYSVQEPDLWNCRFI